MPWVMDRCATCGAKLRPGVVWCGLCSTPPPAVAAPGRPPAAAAADGTTAQETLARLLLGSDVEEMPMELLRGSADPAPFGPRAKRITTGVVVAFAIAT